MTDHDQMQRAKSLVAAVMHETGCVVPERVAHTLATAIAVAIEASLHAQAAALRSHSAQAVPDDAARLDWIKPGFRYLAGTHVEQVLWPDAKGNVTNQVNVPKGSGLRVAIDAAMSAAPKPEGQ